MMERFHRRGEPPLGRPVSGQENRRKGGERDGSAENDRCDASEIVEIVTTEFAHGARPEEFDGALR